MRWEENETDQTLGSRLQKEWIFRKDLYRILYTFWKRRENTLEFSIYGIAWRRDSFTELGISVMGFLQSTGEKDMQPKVWKCCWKLQEKSCLRRKSIFRYIKIIWLPWTCRRKMELIFIMRMKQNILRGFRWRDRGYRKFMVHLMQKQYKIEILLDYEQKRITKLQELTLEWWI